MSRAAAAASQRERLERQLRFDTPFWAGGFTRDGLTGEWVAPRPDGFLGCAKILNKSRKLVNVVPHPWQLEFDDALEAQRAAGKPMRAIVLKARKLGFSTWVALKFLQRLTLLEWQQAIVVAQDLDTAGQIFQMAKLCHAHLPTVEELPIGFSIRPEIVHQAFAPRARKFLQFGERSKRLRENGRVGDSILEIDTANAPEAGRGYTPSMLHLSEVGRWEGEAATRKMLALLNAIPYEPETIVVLESTANGLNHFYRRWVRAREGAKDPDTGETYVPIFVPWQRDPRAALPFPTPEDRERFREGVGQTARFGEVAEDEPMLVEAYGLTPEQLLWRRMQIQTAHEGSVQLFNQENPHSDEAAFIGSGRTVFGGILITRAIKAAEEAPKAVEGSLRAGERLERRSRSGTVLVPQEALWVPGDQKSRDDPVLKVWEHPRRAGDEWPDEVPEDQRVDGAYVVAVDVASGEANTFTEGDFHAIQVFDHRTREQVALHKSRMDIALLPEWALLVALYYNKAWLAVEIQNQGIAVVDPLHKTFRYGRMFRRKRFDRVRQVNEDKPGWSTDNVSKPVMEATFATALAEETHGLRDMETARQLSTYVITEKGKHEAQHGEHDDLLVAAMIAHQVMDLLRPPRAGKRPAKASWEPTDPLTGW
jgi:hypothetical protein